MLVVRAFLVRCRGLVATLLAARQHVAGERTLPRTEGRARLAAFGAVGAHLGALCGVFGVLVGGADWQRNGHRRQCRRIQKSRRNIVHPPKVLSEIVSPGQSSCCPQMAFHCALKYDP